MDLTYYTVINITIQCLGSLILLILIAATLMDHATQTRQERLFLTLLIMLVCLYLADSVDWLFDRVPGVLPRMLCVAGNFITYMMGGITVLIYAVYIYTCVSIKTAIKRITLYLIATATFFYLVLIVVSQFNGMVYTISAENEYMLGEYYGWTLVYIITVHILEVIMTMSYHRVLGVKDAFIISTYAYLPLIFMFGHIVLPDLMLSNVAYLLALVIIYANYQVQQSKKYKIEAAENRAAIMLSQIQPHFLYNSLSAIENLCVEDPQEAKDAVYHFAKYLRCNLDSLHQNELIHFEEELNHIKNYIFLEKKRFRDSLQVKYEIKALDFYVPPLTIQPIMENAVRHGISRKKGRGKVTLCTCETKTHWLVIVSDDGIGFEPDALKMDERSHIGIENVRTRLDIVCGGTLQIDSKPGSGTTVTIQIRKIIDNKVREKLQKKI